LDLRTVVLWNGIFFVSVSALLWVLYASVKPRQPALLYWAAGYSAVVLGAAAFNLRGSIPVLLSIVASNVLLASLFPLIRMGIKALRGERPSARLLLSIAVFLTIIQTWFTVVQDNTAVRTLVFSATAAAAAFFIAYEVLTGGKETAGPRRVVAGIFAGFGLLYAVRIVLILTNSIPQDIMQAASWDAFIQTLITILLSMLALPLASLIVFRLNDQLNASLKERELLLREMTHRIKNDLTLVDSLISLHQSTETDERSFASLEAFRARVRSIAAAHDLFSRHRESIGTIDLRDYFTAVSAGLQIPPRIALDRAFDSAEVPFKTALYLGLLLNELATNALKYAFPDSRPGTLRLSFKVGRTTGTLKVADDGVGTEWPPANRSGIGSMIIDSMVESVRGRLSFANAGGSVFRIDLPLDAGKSKSA
jgi:two-component sensor histidine kinase